MVQVARLAEPGAASVAVHSAYFWAFAAFLVPAELWPVRAAVVEGGVEEVNTSRAFGFALLLSCGLLPAMAATAIASAVAGLARRRRLTRTLFDVAQSSVALALGGVLV